MNNLSILNLSLKKLLSTESDSLERVKIKILFSLLVLSLSKVLVVLFTAWYYQQDFQLNRSVFFGIIYFLLLKLLLSRKTSLSRISHMMVWMGLIVIWSNVLMVSGSLNLVAIQFTFMLIMSSFYLIGSRVAIIASILACLPIMINLVYDIKWGLNEYVSAPLASPGYEILVALNFLTVIVAHYFFNQAFSANIAKQIELNRKLEITAKEANQAAQSKSDFLSAMSHELRTPLNAVIGITDLFLANPKSDDNEENLRILKFSSMSLHALINDILDFNKLSSDKLNLDLQKVNLYELVSDVCSTMKFQFEKKHIDLKVSIDEQLQNLPVLSDATRITQILYNLIGNALKFTAKGSVTVSLKVVRQDTEQISVVFSVADTGIGISKEQQQVVFEPFRQATTSISRNYGGTGLGLAIVRKLLSLFDSDIHLESIPYKGSNFYFNLNLLIDQSTDDLSIELDLLDKDLSEIRILVAEDHVMNRLLLQKVLNKWNNTPVFAENGIEALEKLREDSFDIVLMDLYMPELDGYATAKHIRAMQDSRKSQIPILAFTATVSENLLADIQAAGMNDYLSKPFKPIELYQKLITWL
ncbi:autoinducer 2 sensor kinase/phosphatase LuxQ [Pedobacter glucosidilyticus]|nr:autoinducer 2 sensor kinase/phosphatase LuxQ [Pedobacter glucosidilyticus]